MQLTLNVQDQINQFHRVNINAADVLIPGIARISAPVILTILNT